MSCTKDQLLAGLDTLWDDMESKYNTIEDVKAKLCLILWPVVLAPESEPESDSSATKRGRKKGPMSDEAKAKMVAKRAATIAAKAAGVVPPPSSPVAPVAAVAAPLRIKAPKAKMSKEERSEAAKARYASMSDEGKAAIRERLVKARQAAKESKAQVA